MSEIRLDTEPKCDMPCPRCIAEPGFSPLQVDFLCTRPPDHGGRHRCTDGHEYVAVSQS